MMDFFKRKKKVEIDYTDLKHKLKYRILCTSIDNLLQMLDAEVISNDEYTLVRNVLDMRCQYSFIIHFDKAHHIFKVKVLTDTPMHIDGNPVRMYTNNNGNEYHVTHTKYSITSLTDAINRAMNSETHLIFRLPEDELHMESVVYRLFAG